MVFVRIIACSGSVLLKLRNIISWSSKKKKKKKKKKSHIGQCSGSFEQIKRPVPRQSLLNIDVTPSKDLLQKLVKNEPIKRGGGMAGGNNPRNVNTCNVLYREHTAVPMHWIVLQTYYRTIIRMRILHEDSCSYSPNSLFTLGLSTCERALLTF